MSNQFRSKHDIHPLDPYIKWLANRKLMLVAWAITILSGVMLSYCFHQWTLLPRFGCIGIMIGTLLTLSPLFSDGIYLSNAEAFGFANVDKEGKTSVTSEEGRKVSVNIMWGVVIIIISSAINAFGDLIGSIGGLQLSHGPEFWNALGALGSVGAAIAAAVAAALSWRVGINSAKNQSESLNELKRKNQLDLLYLHAIRANDATQGINHSEWGFVEFTNVMRAIKAAMREIQMLPEDGLLSKKEGKESFKSSLDSQILHALEHEAPPDGAFLPPGASNMAIHSQQMWDECRTFLLK